MDRIYRELNIKHTSAPKVHLDAFILKITVKKSEIELTEKVSDIIERLTENHRKLIEKLTENRQKILLLMISNPYVSKEELSKCVGISIAAISANIAVMRGKYLNRVGPDKGDFWEVIVFATENTLSTLISSPIERITRSSSL